MPNRKITPEEGQRLLRIKLIKKMTWQEFADAIGAKEPTLRQISSGRMPISKQMARRICDRFTEINYDWLFKGEGDMYTEAYMQEQDTNEPYSGYTPKQLIHIIEAKDETIKNLETIIKTKDELVELLRQKIDMLSERSDNNLNVSLKKRDTLQET